MTYHSNYVKNGDFDINKYFIIEDVTDSIDLDEVEKSVNSLKKVINSKEEPIDDLSKQCKSSKDNPYDCPFFKYCTKELVTPNVFDIGWGTHFDKKLDMYYKGYISYEDLLNNGSFNDKVTDQINYELYDLEPKVNKEKIKKLLSSFTYPLYFLDFESYQVLIPTIDGTKPYQQICFQYSLHYYDKEDGELHHKEYLSKDYENVWSL